MGSKKSETAKMDKRRSLMWSLHRLVTQTLIERLKDPDSTVKGSTFAVAIQFLKDNNITVSSKESTVKALEDQLEMVSELPFQ